MKFSGERMIPEVNKGDLIWAEHFVRYIFSGQFVENKKVLDIACGSGFGTYYLAGKKAKQVVGIDISEEAIDYAKEKYSLKNVKFLVGDCEDIPLPDNSIDIVVSFETLEHVSNYEKFIQELKRVSRPGALLILSTPNEKVFPKGNPFHLKEFNYKELNTLLRKYYRNNKFLFENNWFSSAVLSKEGVLAEDLENPQPSIDLIKLASSDPTNSLYFVVLASDSEIPKEVNQKVGLFSPSVDFTTKLAGALQEKEVLDGRIADLERIAKERESELKSIYSSRTWKLADSLRGVKRNLKKLIKPDNEE